MKYLPLSLGVLVNIYFYVNGFSSYGFFVPVGAVLAVTLLSFEIQNRIYQIKNKDKTSTFIFIIALLFSILFNLSGFIGSMLKEEQLNNNLEVSMVDNKKKREDLDANIEYYKGELEANEKNFYFYSYSTLKEVFINPVIEANFIKNGTIDKSTLENARAYKKELEAKIEFTFLEIKKLSSEKKYVVLSKNIFDLMPEKVSLIIKVLFFTFLSLLVALIPSMSIKYINKNKNKFNKTEIALFFHILWYTVQKEGKGYINPTERISDYYLSNLKKEISEESLLLIEKALSSLVKGGVLYELDGKRYPSPGVTGPDFENKLTEKLRSN